MTAKHSHTNASSANELAQQPTAGGSPWCQCEHAAHFDCSAATPAGNREAHPYGVPCRTAVSVKTSRGSFLVCPTCAADCLAPRLFGEGA